MGIPLGCCLNPLLYILFTQIQHQQYPQVCRQHNESAYRRKILDLSTLCQNTNLTLKVRKNRGAYIPVNITGSPVEIISSFRYQTRNLYPQTPAASSERHSNVCPFLGDIRLCVVNLHTRECPDWEHRSVVWLSEHKQPYNLSENCIRNHYLLTQKQDESPVYNYGLLSLHRLVHPQIKHLHSITKQCFFPQNCCWLGMSLFFLTNLCKL